MVATLTNVELQGLARQRALDDFWYFQTKVLRNPFLEEKLHRPLSEWLQEPGSKPKKMLLMSRGHIKSNIATVPYPLWRACKDPNVRILLGSHKDPDAVKFLRSIKLIIKRNGIFQWLFPEIRPMMEHSRPSVWNERQALIARKSSATENTFEICSPQGEVTGRHYDVVILDDLVTAKNVQNAHQIQRTMDFHQHCESLIDPGGEEVVLGTRYDFSDEYGRILETPELAELYDIKVFPAHEPAILHDFISGDRQWTRQDDLDLLIHPKRFTLDKRDYRDPEGRKHLDRKSLPATYISQGPTVYATQYMLEPFDPATAMFREDNIKIVHQLPPGPLRYFRLCDLSSDKLNTTDPSYTVIITICVDEYGQIFITDIFWKNCKPSETCMELIRGQQVPEDRRPKRVSFEKGPYEKAIKPWLRTLAKKHKVWVPIQELPGSFTQKAKIARIEGLEPYIVTGVVYILQGCRNYKKLIEELVKFPKFKRRDIADALAHFPVIVYPGREPQDNVPKEKTIDFKALRDRALIRAVEEATKRVSSLKPLGSRNMMSTAGRQAYNRVRFRRG